MKQIIYFLIFSSFVFFTGCNNPPTKINTFELTSSLQLGKIENIENLGTGFVSCQVAIGGEKTMYYGIGLTSDSLKVGTRVKVFSTGEGKHYHIIVRPLY